MLSEDAQGISSALRSPCTCQPPPPVNVWGSWANGLTLSLTSLVVVPVLGGDDPILLSTMRFEMPGDEGNFRSYEEKRGLSEGPKERLVAMRNPVMTRKIREFTRAMLPELWPFDYGRFEFRYDPVSGAAQFMEVNLSCNLWSKKTISRSAASIGVDHQSLVETIVAHSLARHGLLTEMPVLEAA